MEHMVYFPGKANGQRSTLALPTLFHLFRQRATAEALWVEVGVGFLTANKRAFQQHQWQKTTTTKSTQNDHDMKPSQLLVASGSRNPLNCLIQLYLNDIPVTTTLLPQIFHPNSTGFSDLAGELTLKTWRIVQ